MGWANINTQAGEKGMEGEKDRPLKVCITMVKGKKRRGDKTMLIKLWRTGHEMKRREASHLYILYKCKDKQRSRKKGKLRKPRTGSFEFNNHMLFNKIYLD